MRPKTTRRRHKAAPIKAAAALFRQPGTDFYTLPELEVRGGRIVTEGCRKVLDFTPQRLQLDMGRLVITFYGQALHIESLKGKRAVVGGQVARIDLTAKWEGEHASL